MVAVSEPLDQSQTASARSPQATTAAGRPQRTQAGIPAGVVQSSVRATGVGSIACRRAAANSRAVV